MTQSSPCFELWAIVPELILAGLVILLVPIAAWARGKWLKAPACVAAIGILAALGRAVGMLPWPPTTVFCDTYGIDGFAAVFKILILLGALITLILLVPYFDGHSQLAHAPLLILFSTLGALGLASSLDLGLIVLFLQMLSLASYVLVGLIRGDRLANEATIKYFIYGAVALAVMAYGLTFLFGLTGSLELRAIGHALRGADRIWIAVALGFILVGYAFEMTLAPFHFWAPDVYQGATAPIAGFLSVVPKIAGFAGFLRFGLLALPDNLQQWRTLVAILAVATMLIGNLAALRQSRLKRLLAYSSIAQAGYVLMAVAVLDTVDGALAAAGYYLAAYMFMNLGAFAVIAQIERAFGSDSFAVARGLGRRSPGPAIVLTLSLLSLAGIPPLAGFFGKVLLFSVALQGGLVWLAVIAGANMVVSLYYYVAIVAEMYLKSSSIEISAPAGMVNLFAQLFLTAGTLFLGVFPGAALRLIAAVSAVLHP